jgi:hypothetical protein
MPKPNADNRGRIPLLVKGDKRIGSAGFWNKLIRSANAFRSLRVVRGAYDAFVIGDENAVLSLSDAQAEPGEEPPGGAGVHCYRLKSVSDNYLTCRSWDGSNDGTTDIYIAKVHKLRNSITQEVIEGVTYDYTYATGPDSLNKYRISKVSGVEVERHVVTPEWIVNDLIYAIDATTHVTTATSLLMLGDGRAWALHA